MPITAAAEGPIPKTPPTDPAEGNALNLNFIHGTKKVQDPTG